MNAIKARWGCLAQSKSKFEKRQIVSMKTDKCWGNNMSWERSYDRELDAVFVEAVDQSGFSKSSSRGINSSPESGGQSWGSASKQTESVTNIMNNESEQRWKDSRFR